MSWFKREGAGSEKTPTKAEPGERRVKTEGLWLKCEGCKEIIWKKDLEDNHNVCTKCGAHFRIDAMARLQLLFDGPYQQFDTDLASSDPLEFVDQRSYRERLASAQDATSLADALIAAAGTLD